MEERWLDGLARRAAGRDAAGNGPHSIADAFDAVGSSGPVTRRSLIRRASAAVAGVAATLIPGAASAGECGVNERRCNGRCVNIKRNENHCGRCNHACGDNQYCSKGKCCKKGRRNCNGKCVNLRNDENNCGSCGNVCSGLFGICTNGLCI